MQMPTASRLKTKNRNVSRESLPTYILGWVFCVSWPPKGITKMLVMKMSGRIKAVWDSLTS